MFNVQFLMYNSDLGDLPAGLYHCRILQDEQLLQTEKLSVIRR